jgi:hypothetical protein
LIARSFPSGGYLHDRKQKTKADPVKPLNSRFFTIENYLIGRPKSPGHWPLGAAWCLGFCQQFFRFAQEALRLGILRPAKVFHPLSQPL